ncbi:MAG: 50S ribosomal protein L9 [Patescibacteria group bacterium]
MKVILLENIKKLGKKFEVVEVADGYARNFLLPEGKAQMATEGNLNSLEKRKAKEEKKAKKKEEEVKDLISEIENKEFSIEMKVGEKDQLFESVDSKDISEKLKEEGFDVESKQIKLDSPIKEVTEQEVELEFDYNLKTKIKIKIEDKNK